MTQGEHWARTKQTADAYLPHQKVILAQELIVEAPEVEDQKHNSDLVVLRMDTVRVACRVRLPGSGYAERYPFDVTFRCERPRSGAESELTKFVNGWGDFMLYGFGAESGEPKLERWVLVDLTALRALGLRHPKWFHSWARRTRKNPDGSSSFVVMRTDDVLARNHGVIRAASPGYYAKGSVPANTNGRIW